MATIRLYQPGEVPVALLSNVLPAPIDGNANAGTSTFAARADHNHDDSLLREYIDSAYSDLSGQAAERLSEINAAADDALANIATKTSAFEFEIDFGQIPTRIKRALISLPLVTSGKPISVNQSGNVSLNRPQDEIEMDAFSCFGYSSTDGQLNVVVHTLFGPVTGKYKFIATF